MAVLADDQTIYSADSHVVEPADLWIEYIEPEFRDRAPHLEHRITRDDGTQTEGEFLVCDGIAPQRVATFAAADVDDPRKRAEAGQRGYEQIRRGGVTKRQKAALAVAKLVRLHRRIGQKFAIGRVRDEADVSDRTAKQGLKDAVAKGWVSQEPLKGSKHGENELVPGPGLEEESE